MVHSLKWRQMPCVQNGFIPLEQSTNVTTFANNISALRAKLSGAADDFGITFPDGTNRIVTADENAIAFSRTPEVRGLCLAKCDPGAVRDHKLSTD